MSQMLIRFAASMAILTPWAALAQVDTTPAFSLTAPASAVPSFLAREDAPSAKPWDWAEAAGGREGHPNAAGEFVYYRHEGLGIWFGPFETASAASVALGDLRALAARLREENPERYGTARVVRFRGVGDDWTERLLEGGEEAVELRWLLESLDGLDAVTASAKELDALDDELDGLTEAEQRERLEGLSNQIRELELRAAGESLEAISAEVFGGAAVVDVDVADGLRFEAGAMALGEMSRTLDVQSLLNDGATGTQMLALAETLRLGLESRGVSPERAAAAVAAAERFARSGRLLEPPLVSRTIEQAGQALMEHMAEGAGIGRGAVTTQSIGADTAQAVGQFARGMPGGRSFSARAEEAAASAAELHAMTRVRSGSIGLTSSPSQGPFAVARLMMAMGGDRSNADGDANSGIGSPGQPGSQGALNDLAGLDAAAAFDRVSRVFGRDTASRAFSQAGVNPNGGSTMTMADASALAQGLGELASAFGPAERSASFAAARGVDIGSAATRGLSGQAATNQFRRSMEDRVASEIADAVSNRTGRNALADGVSESELRSALAELTATGVAGASAVESALAEARRSTAGDEGERRAGTNAAGSAGVIPPPSGARSGNAGAAGVSDRMSAAGVERAARSLARAMLGESSGGDGPSGSSGRTGSGAGSAGSAGTGATSASSRSGAANAGVSGGIPGAGSSSAAAGGSSGSNAAASGTPSSSFMSPAAVRSALARADVIASAVRNASGENGSERRASWSEQGKGGEGKQEDRRLIRTR